MPDTVFILRQIADGKMASGDIRYQQKIMNRAANEMEKLRARTAMPMECIVSGPTSKEHRFAIYATRQATPDDLQHIIKNLELTVEFLDEDVPVGDEATGD